MVGQFFTPESVAKCLFKLSGAQKGDRVIDPACGDGAFLKTAPPWLRLFGCEVDPFHAAMAQRHLPQDRVFCGDALTSLTVYYGAFDIAIGNPPFSARSHRETRASVLAAYDL